MTLLGAGALGAGIAFVVSFVLAIMVHERREFRRMDARELRDQERHDQVIKEVRDARALALGVIAQGKDHERRIAKLEGHRGG